MVVLAAAASASTTQSECDPGGPCREMYETYGIALTGSSWDTHDDRLGMRVYYWRGRKADTSICTYYFDPKDYQVASSTIQLEAIAFKDDRQLNDNARKEMEINRRVFTKVDCRYGRQK